MMVDQLQADDEVENAIGRAVARVRLEEPVGHDAVLGDAVEHAVGADDGRVDRARQDQEADDDHEGVEQQLEPSPGRPRSWPGRRSGCRNILHAHVVGDHQHGQEADAAPSSTRL